MKSISENLKDHLEGEVTSLCTLVKIMRKDAVVIALTDHDEDVTHDGTTYVATAHLTPSAVVSASALSVDDTSIEAVLSSELISEDDILAGRYDDASVTLMLINYAAPDDGVLILRHGVWGEVQLVAGQFMAELRGLAQKLQHEIGELFSPNCRATLGDARCGVNLAGYTVSGSVEEVNNRHVFKDSTLTQATGYFDHGTLTWITGDNAGLSAEVKGYIPGEVTLLLAANAAISAGDTYEIKAGCDKRSITCRTRFGNMLNFRGEPHVPGLDRLYQSPNRS